MHVLHVVLALVWGFSVFAMVWGSLFTVWRIKWASPREADEPPPVSILKPLKGVDPGLFDNLCSFAQLDYPAYEVIFSVADPLDRALGVVAKVRSKFPDAPFRVIVGDVKVGGNPKVNNLVRPEADAVHDFLLVSDSNIRAHASYLSDIVPHLTPETGVVTSVIAGFGGLGLGGLLEEQHLNSFNARWMSLAHSFDSAFVIGKTMLYRRSDAASFGGIAALGRFMAEDFWMGRYMTTKVKKKVKLTRKPVHQYIGSMSIQRFLARHTRWAVLRRKSAPHVFYLEPFQFTVVVSLIGALALSGLTTLSGIYALIATPLTYAVLDFWLIGELGGRPSALGWVLKEALVPFIWLDALMGSTVEWRGTKIKVKA